MSILRIAKPAYDPTGERGDGPALRTQCEAWVIDKQQAEAFFRHARRIKSTASHDYYHLPCSATGELAAEGKVWAFEINAAATATWKNGDEIRSFGCSDPACEPLVLMMPDSGDEPSG